MTAPLLLRGVDLAAFAVALVNRLHTGGVVVAASGPAGFVEALRHDWPGTRSQLYWAARLTLVNRVEDLAAFDAVFEAVFADAVLGVDPPGLKQSMGTTAADRPWCARPCQASSRKAACRGPPAPRRSPPSTTHAADIGIPDTLPSRIVVRADEPFERFDTDDLRLLGEWLERCAGPLAPAPQPASRTAPARQAD